MITNNVEVENILFRARKSGRTDRWAAYSDYKQELIDTGVSSKELEDALKRLAGYLRV